MSQIWIWRMEHSEMWLNVLAVTAETRKAKWKSMGSCLHVKGGRCCRPLAFLWFFFGTIMWCLTSFLWDSVWKEGTNVLDWTIDLPTQLRNTDLFLIFIHTLPLPFFFNLSKVIGCYNLHQWSLIWVNRPL